MIEIFFPTSERVDERWAMESLCEARQRWMDQRGFISLKSNLRQDPSTEQWSYPVWKGDQ